MKYQFRSYFHYRKIASSARGATDLIVMAAALPIFLGLGAILYDLTRAPLSDDFMKKVLVASLDKAASNVPRGFAGLRTLSTREVSSGMLQASCDLARAQLNASGEGYGSSLIGGSRSSLSKYAFDFAVLELDPSSGTLTPTVIEKLPCAVDIELDAFHRIDPVTVSRALANEFSSTPSASPGAGAWGVAGSHGAKIPSRWLLGIGYSKVKTGYLGFMLHGNNGETEVSNYALRALTDTRGLSSTSLPFSHLSSGSGSGVGKGGNGNPGDLRGNEPSPEGDQMPCKPVPGRPCF